MLRRIFPGSEPVPRTGLLAFRDAVGHAQQQLVRVSDGGLDEFDQSWKLPNKPFPYSCTDEEGALLAAVISHNELTRGFEVATAFGYSAAYAGLGFAKTGGRLQTMDCYVEEWKEKYNYEPEEMKQAVAEVLSRRERGELPFGLQMAREIARLVGVKDRIEFHIGLSPTDVPALLGGSRLDYAFIDGGHFGDQPSIDFRTLLPYLADRCAVFFHDNNDNLSVEAAVRLAEKELGVQSLRLPTRYGVTLVGRGLKPDTAAQLAPLCIRNYLPPIFSVAYLRRRLRPVKRAVRQLVGKVEGKG